MSISLTAVIPTRRLAARTPPNLAFPNEPLNTSEVLVEFGMNVNVESESSNPKKPSLALESS